MNIISYGISAIFVLLAVTLMAGTLLNGSVLAQQSSGPIATVNATSEAATTAGLGLDVSIYSKTTNTDYIYNDIMSQQELTNAISEVEALTHPESASMMAAGTAEAEFADQSNNQLAAEIFQVASMTSDSIDGSDAETSSSFFDDPCSSGSWFAKHVKFVQNPCFSQYKKFKDLIITAEKKKLTTLFS